MKHGHPAGRSIPCRQSAELGNAVNRFVASVPCRDDILNQRAWNDKAPPQPGTDALLRAAWRMHRPSGKQKAPRDRLEWSRGASWRLCFDGRPAKAFGAVDRAARSEPAQPIFRLRRKRLPTARPAMTLVQASTVAGSGAGIGLIEPPCGEYAFG